MSALPPGQFSTPKWPLVHIGDVPPTDLARWRLDVYGEVAQPLRLTWADVASLPAHEVRCDLHCVIRWSRLGLHFRGLRWSTLAELVRPARDAAFVLAHGAGGYSASLPLDVLAAPDTLLAYEAEGRPLTPEHGAPLRLIVPSLYLWKSTKWLSRLELCSDARLGFWERFGYHELGDPWREQRAANNQPERLYGFGAPPRKRIRGGG